MSAFGGKADIGLTQSAFDPKRTFGPMSCCHAKMTAGPHFAPVTLPLGRGAESLPGYSRTVGPDRSGGETRAAFASNQHGIVWQYQSGVGGLALPRDGRWRRFHDAR